ncbi:UbiA family prenyltransferase [Vibrio splendidus]|uniref:UbiA family prenyltransferase n=1 Tax=Vibrio splendidus TaxID=29497 RepID=UPI002236AEF1|nr:UbiA family prenyltransferase [Vibrio splendidus]MCW4438891.1 UbiA family prenyltransferase [Vibrio splendidus]
MENVKKTHKIGSIIELLRVRQYTKNLLIALPAFLAIQSQWIDVVAGVFVFSMLASAVYCINDAKDAIADSYHPKKQYRPIPSNRISEKEALQLAGLLIISSFSTSWYFGLGITSLLLAYLIINVFYSTIAKELAGVDVLIVSIGFFIRTLVGLEFVKQPETLYWILWPLFLASLSLSIGKRYSKLSLQNSDNRTSKLYTDKLLLGLLLSTSFITVYFSTILLNENIYSLIKYSGLNADIVNVISLVLIILYSRCIFLITYRKCEPATIFFSDKPIIFGLFSCAIIISFVLKGP